MGLTLRPCSVCGTTDKAPLARRCDTHARKMNPASLANLNKGEKDLSTAQIEAILKRLERPRWRSA